MADWLSSMQQTYEFYEVDPGTWQNKRKLDNILACTITRDLEDETLGYATIDITDELDECYIRVYLVTTQSGVVERFPLGVYLCQTPSTKFDGRMQSVTIDAYTPLIELKEKMPPIGYAIMAGRNIMSVASELVRENVRAPVVPGVCSDTIYSDFVSDLNDTWMSFLNDFIANAKHEFSLDELGRILFAPQQDLNSLQPVWDYNDDNSSILYPDLEVSRDLYGVPNVMEVVYSQSNHVMYSRAENNDENSPISTVNRGREIVSRVTDPEMAGEPTQSQLDVYAKQLLRNASSLEYTLTYSHGYCPVRVGDCVRLNYKRAGMVNVKAKVIRQTIKCEPGCKVEETAVFTRNLWSA